MNVSTDGRNRAGPARLATPLLIGLLAACTTTVPGASPISTPAPAAPSRSDTTTLRPTATPVDDPTTAAVEVAGELRTWEVGDGTTTTAGEITQSRNNSWDGDYTTSDPLVSGVGRNVLNLDFWPDGSALWWGAASWEPWQGVNLGALRVDDVHEGDLVLIGKGAAAGLELRLHMYFGPGANTSGGDRFELTGSYGNVERPGWSFDAAYEGDVSATLADLVAAWDAGDGQAVAAFYSSEAVYTEENGTAVTGPGAIAALVQDAADGGISRQLSESFVALGNYAVAAVRRTEGDRVVLELVTLRFDPAGRVVYQEIAATASHG